MTGIFSAVRLTASKNPKHGTTIARSENRADVLPHWKAGEVVIVWTDNTPIRHWPEATLAKARKTRLRRKLDAKFPLFADELFNRELEARPSFFKGIRHTEKDQSE